MPIWGIFKDQSDDHHFSVNIGCEEYSFLLPSLAEMKHGAISWGDGKMRPVKQLDKRQKICYVATGSNIGRSGPAAWP
jgi:hypothetical protein